MRHSREDHLVEQILGLGKGLVAGLTLALSVRQVGEIDDETAFFGRDQIDRPCRRAGYLFHPSLLSQIADRQAELPQDGVQQAGLQLAAAVDEDVPVIWPRPRRRGKGRACTFPQPDLFIAATAILHDLCVVQRR